MLGILAIIFRQLDLLQYERTFVLILVRDFGHRLWDPCKRAFPIMDGLLLLLFTSAVGQAANDNQRDEANPYCHVHGVGAGEGHCWALSDVLKAERALVCARDRLANQEQGLTGGGFVDLAFGDWTAVFDEIDGRLPIAFEDENGVVYCRQHSNADDRLVGNHDLAEVDQVVTGLLFKQ